MSDKTVTPPPLLSVPCRDYLPRTDIPIDLDPELALRKAFATLATGACWEIDRLPLIDLHELAWSIERLGQVVASLTDRPELVNVHAMPGVCEHLEQHVGRGVSHQAPDAWFVFEKTVVVFAVRFEPFDWPTVLSQAMRDALGTADADRAWLFVLNPSTREVADRNLDYEAVCELCDEREAELEAQTLTPSAHCDWCSKRFECRESPHYSRPGRWPRIGDFPPYPARKSNLNP
jgi:hypothetical protein